MLKRRLPKGEETIPIVVIERLMLSPLELMKEHPRQYEVLVSRRKLVYPMRVTDELLVERVRRRYAQGRVATIYRLITDEEKELTPEEQIRHIEQRTKTGLELIEAERKLLEEELSILRESV